MRDLFVDKQELHLLYKPKESRQLELFENPEFLFSGKMKFHKYPEGFSANYGSSISSVVCKLLLTNMNHDGIWLIAEDDKNKVSIPGGHIGEDVLYDIEHSYSYTVVYKTLIRELIEENPIIRGTGFDDEINVNAMFNFVLNRYGFNHILPTNSPLYYSYDDYKGSFIIYMVKETDIPSVAVTPFTYRGFRNMIWYSRKEHSLNMKAKGDRRSLLGTDYDNDIRVVPRGLKILDRIFSTENIFGKLNIY